jgi:hypothetical protein
MIINMTTIAIRPVQYIGETLESLFESDGRDVPVNLILGSADTSHIEPYRKLVANLVIWDQEARFLSREANPRRNCSVNALRALRYGDDDFCLTCEDDIGFAKNWLSELTATVAQIDRKDYALNLGQTSVNTSDLSPDKRYLPHFGQYLCGAQGIFYPNKAFRHRVADYLQNKLSSGLNDMLVGKYAKEHAALFCTTPPLVFHKGQVSSFTRRKQIVISTPGASR